MITIGLLTLGRATTLTFDKEIIHNLQPFKQKLFVGDNSIIPVEGIGSVTIKLEYNTIKLKNVLYAPLLKKQLISISQLVSDNYNVEFLENIASISKNKNQLGLRTEIMIFTI